MKLGITRQNSTDEMAIRCAGLDLVSTWVPPVTQPKTVRHNYAH
ncbi:MAG: hypothetical protein ACI8V2_000567 [Candidatus Latescibacterota bacterium]|jgi:hypothetical protein